MIWRDFAKLYDKQRRIFALQVVLFGLLFILPGCDDAPPPQAQGPLQVRIVQVQGDRGERTISVPGEVAFRRETPLAFVTGGRIASVLVSEGDFVRSGQPLARLDTTVLDAEVARTETELQRRTNELRRIEALFADGWVTRSQLEEVDAVQKSATAAARTAAFNRTGGVLTAPGQGIVLARLAEPGQVLPVGVPVLRLGKLGSGYVLRVPLNDRALPRVIPGAPVQARIDALGNKFLSGWIVEFGGEADRRTGSFVIEISLPPDPELRSGQIGNAVIAVSPSAGSDDTVLVPTKAVFDARGGQGFVYIFDPVSRRARLKRVDLASPSGEAVQVTAGIQPKTWVVVSKLEQIHDGMTVVPVTAGS